MLQNINLHLGHRLHLSHVLEFHDKESRYVRIQKYIKSFLDSLLFWLETLYLYEYYTAQIVVGWILLILQKHRRLMANSI